MTAEEKLDGSSDLLYFVLKYLAFKAPHHRTYIDPDKERVYTLIRRVAQEFGNDFPELQHYHFGRSWYSYEVYQDLWVLYESGLFDEENKVNGFIGIRWSEDSEEYVKKIMADLFDKDERLRQRFEEMAEQFREIVKTEKELTAKAI